MKPWSTDTRCAAQRVQIALLHQDGLVRRVDLATEMTSFAIAGAHAALRRRYPTASELEIQLLFVEQQYGPRLGAQLRAALMHPVETHDIVPGRFPRGAESVLR